MKDGVDISALLLDLASHTEGTLAGGAERHHCPLSAASFCGAFFVGSFHCGLHPPYSEDV